MKSLSNRPAKALLVLIMLALCIAGFLSLLALRSVQAQNLKDNEELVRMYQEDQADRSPANAKNIDWAIVGPRDKARLIPTAITSPSLKRLIKRWSDSLPSAARLVL